MQPNTGKERSKIGNSYDNMQAIQVVEGFIGNMSAWSRVVNRDRWTQRHDLVEDTIHCDPVIKYT